MELTPKIFSSIIPQNIRDNEYTKIKWSDVTDLDKENFAVCTRITDSLEFVGIEYKAVRKHSNFAEHKLRGYEGISVAPTLVYVSGDRELRVITNAKNYLVFQSVPADLYRLMSLYDPLTSHSYVSIPSFVRSYMINRISSLEITSRTFLEEYMLSDKEIERAHGVIRAFGEANTDLTRRFHGKLMRLVQDSDDPRSVLIDYRKLAEFIKSQEMDKYSISLLERMIGLTVSHLSETTNLTDAAIDRVVTSHVMELIHED